MKEIWKEIEGYEGLYEVSNYGNVRSMDKKVFNGKSYYHKKGEIKSKISNGRGYHNVSLYKDGKGKHHKVHQLVAKAFIPNPEGYKLVNHIDCNKINNNVTNLEWCNHKMNYEHAKANNLTKNPPILKGEKSKWSKPVYMYSLDGEFIKEFINITEALAYIGVKNPSSCTSNVNNVCKGRKEKAYGYKWKYKE